MPGEETDVGREVLFLGSLPLQGLCLQVARVVKRPAHTLSNVQEAPAVGGASPPGAKERVVRRSKCREAMAEPERTFAEWDVELDSDHGRPVSDSNRSRQLFDQAVKLQFGEEGGQRTSQEVALFEEAIVADDRNMRAYRELASIYLFRLHDSRRAREYALAGLDIKEVPPELLPTRAKVEREVADYRDTLHYILFRAALDDGEHDQARATLPILAAHWEAGHGGHYQTAIVELRAGEQSRRHADKSRGCALLIAAVGAGAIVLRALGL